MRGPLFTYGEAMNPATEVYLFKCMGYYKIGISVNAEWRCKNLSGMMPKRGKMIRKWDCGPHARAVEQYIHRAYKKFRTNGEWFKFPPEVLANFTEPDPRGNAVSIILESEQDA